MACKLEQGTRMSIDNGRRMTPINIWTMNTRIMSMLLLCSLAVAACTADADDLTALLRDGEFLLWDPASPFPSHEQIRRPEGAVEMVVHLADEQYRFLHDNAVVWHNDRLLAAWYNCPYAEIVDESLIRGRWSDDGGTTWSDVVTIAEDEDDTGTHYVPVAFLSHEGTLYAYITNMVGHDLVTQCEVFVLDEQTGEWTSHGFIAERFLPNCEPVLMEDGNYIMAGRVADEMKTHPETPAVAISNGGRGRRGQT